MDPAAPRASTRSISPVAATPPTVSSTARPAAHAGVDIGAAVLDLDTGRIALGDGGSDPFYAASVAKLLALRGATDTGADGFDQAFGLIAPPRPDGVAATQGWMWIGSEFSVHTTGLVDDDHYAVALLSRHTASLSSAVARSDMDEATGAALDPLLG